MSATSPARFAQVKNLFIHCVELPVEQRLQKLAELTGGDRELFNQVREMIDAAARDGGGETRIKADPKERPQVARDLDVGTTIGPYKLKEQIGEGGMGVVYVAEQKKPVRRQVALKLIKPGMDSRQVIGRFEAERQALAMMDHPNIARMIDGGIVGPVCRTGPEEPQGPAQQVGPTGRPYFVMELVRGVPITDYCDLERLTIRERLEIFLQVCNAVQHAHQKGIIHRDLKPTNVLVSRHEDRAVAKVIDFGVAKAISQSLTEHSVYTQFSQMIGTPLYMSPEQTQISGLDVDTRSDVYSLGVMLYELLTGSTPFDKATLQEKGLDELRRIIREDEPAQPSHRLSTLKADAGSTISQKRSLEPHRLMQLVRGELDWIVMRALEKDRTRRYQSASDLADDVRRYLDDQPVNACPPSKLYRMKKLAKRNRGTLVTAAVVLLALVAGTGISVWQAIDATHARDLAEERLASEQKALKESERDRKSASEARALAETRLKNEQTASRINLATLEFLHNDLLVQAAPVFQAEFGHVPDHDIKLRTVLDRAAKRIPGRFPNDPLVEAKLEVTIGQVYTSLGEYRAAEIHLEQALAIYRRKIGENNVLSVRAMNYLGRLYVDSRQHKKAAALAKKKYDIAIMTLTEESDEAMLAATHLGWVYMASGNWDAAHELLSRTFEISCRKLGKDDRQTLTAMHNLAALYFEQGKLDRAQPLFEQRYSRLLAQGNRTLTHVPNRTWAR